MCGTPGWLLLLCVTVLLLWLLPDIIRKGELHIVAIIFYVHTCLLACLLHRLSTLIFYDNYLYSCTYIRCIQSLHCMYYYYVYTFIACIDC